MSAGKFRVGLGNRLYCKILSTHSPLLLVTTTGKFGARHCQVKAELLPCSRAAVDLEVRFQACTTLEKLLWLSEFHFLHLSCVTLGVCVRLCPSDGLFHPSFPFCLHRHLWPQGPTLAHLPVFHPGPWISPDSPSSFPSQPPLDAQTRVS